MLFHLQDSLKAVVLDQPQNDDDASDDDSDLSSTSGETPAVIRIAAHAGVLLIEKYMDLTWDCEIYVISIVMCPDRKLQFLKDYVSSEKLKEIKKMVINRWSKTYAPAQSQIPVAKKNTKEKSKWAAPSSASSGSSKYPADSIQAYLAESVASSDAITDAGGYMKYWYQMRNTRPGLSRMGQAFCSAPGLPFLII
ncbi:hypothetical protein BDZ97DRAFT_1320807 [Flammula alnicola]|nr:hypothetical protein BDZ97DRAFT_1320807 [Flammula alnicola]